MPPLVQRRSAHDNARAWGCHRLGQRKDCMNHARLWAALVCVAGCHCAEASRTSLADESDVADAGDCESELVWEQVRRRGEATQRERALRLTCGVGGNTELEVVHARLRSGAARGEALVFEAKTTLRDRGPGRIGWAVALGVGTERIGGAWRRSEQGFAVEATRQFGDAWLVEARFGAVRDVLSRRDSTLWALALEHAPHERLELRAEVEGDDRGRPEVKLGLRYTLWPDRAQLKLSHGVRGGGQRAHRTSLGLQLEF
jgi:hypothetical protein